MALAGVNDLIAAEGKYHLKCYSKFTRDASEVRDSAAQHTLAISWLCVELKKNASRRHILELDEVWKYYAVM